MSPESSGHRPRRARSLPASRLTLDRRCSRPGILERTSGHFPAPERLAVPLRAAQAVNPIFVDTSGFVAGVLWVKGGIIYAVVAPLGEQDVLRIAGSLR